MAPKLSKKPQGKKGKGCLKGCLVVFVLFIAFIIGGIVYSSRDWCSDESVLKNYQPTAEIAEIADKDTMTDHGRATFYRTSPKFVDGETFRKTCVANGVEALGCTTGFKIFFLKIDDPMFSDHKYAAAAHEMLHVVYRRTSGDEKKRLNALLDQEFSKHQDNPNLTGPIEILKKKEKTDEEDILDELHSKFAVEYLDLSPELEEHYRQYFENRSKVVELFKSGGFDSRVRGLEELEREAKALEPKLSNMRNQLTAYQNAGDVASYNSLVPQFNNMVYQYNAKAAESQRIYSEVVKFYQYFNPSYEPPEEKTQQ